MPLLSPIARRSWGTRIVVALMYILLVGGAVTMVYPLALMLSGSVKSEADFSRASVLPQYWYDDAALWQKYLESKYNEIPAAEMALGRPVGSWRLTTPPAKVDRELVEEFRAFRASASFRREWYTLGHTSWEKIVSKNTRAFRRLAQERFNGSLDAYCNAVQIRYPAWSYVGAPMPNYSERRFTWPRTAAYQVYDELKTKSAKADWCIVNLDGAYWYNYVAPTYGGADSNVVLSAHPPPAGRARDDWETYVRGSLNLAYIRMADSALPAFRAFLKKRFTRIEDLNHLWETSYQSFDDVPLGNLSSVRAQVDLSEFVKDRVACPAEAISVYGPRQGFEEFLAKNGIRLGERRLPIVEADWVDFLEQRRALRWEFTRQNYLTVFDYLWAHGNGIRNTIIYCTLMVLANLLVNPLAAYALSRYRPPSTYKVLLLCMCTMAFPAEVTMIPAFLLMKRFPIWEITAAIAVASVATFIVSRIRKSEILLVVIWLSVFLATFLLPRWWGRGMPTVSLLNTFWALVLPGMANGFSIFLLKGFFDSLPRDLYEAADIDGASEWSKFWLITMSLSKPILAVLALSAFTHAYSEFMMALVIIPDPSMWTLMVWLYQLQTFAHPSVVYASLVVAAIPTLLIFLLCQNLIIRGIVVPVEK